MTNMNLCANIIQNLMDQGVREFCLCAGARNSPLIHLFDQNPEIKIHNFFEERSAAFFAIGRIVDSKRPVVVITTSGTAVAELLPATIEAHYSGLPLILLTADRPKSYRHSGAPQSIEQVGIFSSYVEQSWDLDHKDTELNLNRISFRRPLHINLCLKEPLLDGPVPQLHDREMQAPIRELKLSEEVLIEAKKTLNSFLAKTRPLVILGAMTEVQAQITLEFLKRFKAPVYAEALSNLRAHSEISEFEIQSGEKMLNQLFSKGVVDSVLRIGGVPTVRLWRDLEEIKSEVPVLNITATGFSGLSRKSESIQDFSLLERLMSPTNTDHEWKKWDLTQLGVLNQLFQQYPKSEPALVREVSQITKSDPVYLGNSLPIREWDLCACFQFAPSKMLGNRGANGIDGQVSTYLGWSESFTSSWCIVGDLTAMYDLAALWIAKQKRDSKFRIVVVNNGGGQIFKRMFGKDIFLNRHSIEFENWAKMFDVDYLKASDLKSDLSKNLPKQVVIEVHPDEGQTAQFWQAWEQSWQK